ncbi:RHS repeat protein [Proteus hauseri]|uniref:RHS repeat protein n=1 Tax=Proteus hauseri TaxID=183417 RepID=UPI0013E8F979|nr:RHS repeat protein [Proteus hauseri]
MSNKQLHTRTPTVVVLDNRGSTIREINYCRHPDAINQTDERITRHHFHARGYLERSIDARLYETQQSDSTIQPNIQQTVSLGGLLSAIKSVDSGNSFNISDIENKKVMDINGLGLVTEYHYTKPEFVSQLIAIMESSPTSKQILKERFTWGEADNKNIANNSVGKCTHHDFLAGRTEYGAYALTGQSLIELRFITANANTVKIPAHSQYQTRNIYDATGQLLKQIDASGHEREWQYDRAGFLKQSSVQLHSDKKQLVIKAINYSAAGQKLRVEHGNGIVTTYEYEAETQRLLHVKTQRPQGHVLGAKIMQDLRYEYDPVGNIICLKNDAEATRYWRNQKIVPENRYVYDSLYQLVSATGRESANQQTPALTQSRSVTTLVKDAQSYTNYTRLYTYDSGGNLVQLRHLSGIAQQSFTQNICVSNKTNRALLETQQVAIEQIDQQFDALGNQKHLSTGDALQWDLRGTLAQVNKRGNSEHYVYASASQRLMKQQVQRLSERHIITETRYLPNLEIWQSTQGGHLTEHREVVDITGNVRALCWKVGLPKGIKNNQLRYSNDDGVGNSGLETDGQGQLVSYEEYYPYGGTAIWSSENAVEANYKTIRYSGKEKDATGMYYYGYRYYQPWIGRWLSADPAGTVDGLNLYRMVRNNPVTLRDPDGRAPTPTSEHFINRLPTSFHKIKTDEWGESIIQQAETWNQEDLLDFKRETHYAVSKLGRHFSLYSTPDHPSKQLIVNAHGGFNLNSATVRIPDRMTLEFLNPHRTYLIDPGLDNIVVDKSLTLFSISNRYLKLHNRFAIESMELLGIRTVTGAYNDIIWKEIKPYNKMNWKVAGNDRNGVINITNYELTTYENETPDTISNALAANRAITQTNQEQTVRTDIVTVSDTITSDGFSFPSITTIGRLFNDLKANNIKYDNIVCEFCRGKDDRPNMDYIPKLQRLE